MTTVKMAAQQLGVSATLVYALCAAGKIRHERHGLGRGTIRIPDDALLEYRRKQTVGPGEKKHPPPPAPSSGPFTMLDGERLARAWQGQEH